MEDLQATRTRAPVIVMGLFRKSIASLMLVVLATPMAFSGQPVLRDTPNLMVLREGSASGLVRGVDGSLLVMGDFDHFDGIRTHHLARLDAHGTVDPVWRPGDLGSITAVAGSASGDVFVATTTAASERRLRRLTANGDAAPGWEVSLNGGINSMEFDALGRLLVAGGFTLIGGQPRDGFAVLSPQTGLVDPFEPALPEGYVRAVRAAPDGAIHLIVQQDGSTKLLRIGLDGALDPAWSITVEGHASELAVAANGDVFVATFGADGGINRTRLIKVLAQDGSIDPVWNPTAGWDNNSGSISSIDVDANGSVFVAGTFGEIAGATRPGIAKLQGQGAGANDPDWLPPAWVSHPYWHLVSKALVHDGQLQIVGSFAVTDQASRPIGAARLDLMSGELIIAQQAASSGKVTALLRQQSGGTIVAGDFLQINGQPRSRLARLDAAWQVDPAWILPLDGEVHALAEDSAGRVLIGGAFDVPGYPQLQNLIRVDGAETADVDQTWLPDIEGRVQNLALDTQGRVYLAGTYLTVAGQNLGNLVRLHPVTGLSDPGWAPAIQGATSGLLLTDNGFVYTTYSSGGFARLWRHPITGSGQADSSWTTGSNGSFADQIVTDGSGNLIVAGSYPVGMSSVATVTAFPTTGTGVVEPLWTHEFPGQGRGVAISASGFIYATGWFGWDRGGLIRIHADGQLDNSLPLTVAGSGEALQLQADGSLLLAGAPGSVLGQHRSGVAALEFRDDHLFADGFQP